VASYFAILAVWPYYMPRFWAPVLPLVACFAWIGCKTFSARFQWPAGAREIIVATYCVLFIALGFDTFSMEWRNKRPIAGQESASQRSFANTSGTKNHSS
jgi:hypothetical protein